MKNENVFNVMVDGENILNEDVSLDRAFAIVEEWKNTAVNIVSVVVVEMEDSSIISFRS